MKPRIPLLPLLPMLPVLGALAAGCRPTAATPAAAAPAKVQVETLAVAAEPVPATLAVTGALKANEESDVASNASGRVIRTFVERGSVVAKGAPLAELDMRQSALSVTEANADLESAVASKALADAECERYQRLFDKGAITLQELQKTTSSCRTSAQSVAAAESRVRQKRETLADAVIRAPFAGVVGERYVSVGEYVQPSTKIAHLVQSTPLRIELSVPEAHVSAVRVGLQVAFEVAAVRGRTFTGTVRYVAPNLRTTTRDLVFEAVVPNADGALKSGMFASARLALGTERLPVVPRAALRQDGENVRAFVVKDGRLEERVLKPGPNLGDRIAIRSGLAEGERIAAKANPALSDGLAVQ